jgi:hypothetical protein
MEEDCIAGVERARGLDTNGGREEYVCMRHQQSLRKRALLELSAAGLILFIVVAVLGMIFLYRPA